MRNELKLAVACVVATALVLALLFDGLAALNGPTGPVVVHSGNSTGALVVDTTQEGGKLEMLVKAAVDRIHYLETQNAIMQTNLKQMREASEIQVGLPLAGVDPNGDVQLLDVTEVGALRVTFVPEGGLPVSIVNPTPEKGALMVVPEMCPIPPSADLNEFVNNLTVDCFVIFKAPK